MRRLALAVALVVLAGCAADSKYAALPVPKSSPGQPTTTSSAPPRNLEEIELPGVGGTTTTEAPRVGPGPATIVGRVDGPDGPVPGAIVELDRWTGDRYASMQVPTAADGTWNAQKVLGGRYRVRAWLAPSLSMAKAQTVFVDESRPAAVNLRVDRFGGLTVDAAIAPNPPVVGQPTSLAVRVLQRQVDAKGVVSDVPVSTIPVTLTGSGSWTSTSGNPTYTGTDGVARFVVECLKAGDNPLSAQLPDGTSQPLNLPPCSPAPTSTSTTPTSSTTSTTR